MAPWQDTTHMLLTSATSEKGRVEGGKGGGRWQRGKKGNREGREGGSEEEGWK